MGVKHFKHQEKFAENYQGKRLLVHGTGTGKTVCACLWLRDKRDADALIVCPKQVVEKWRKALTVWGTKATVVSKEEFKKLGYKKWSAIVLDEADCFASPLFTNQRSQLAEHTYYTLEKADAEVLLLTATPIRSTPWNLHTLLIYLGYDIDYKKWRDYFFRLEKKPYLARPAYIPHPKWREMILPTLHKYADIINIEDLVSELPPVTVEVVKMKELPFEPTEWEATAQFYEKHRFEQKEKHKEILRIAKGYSKVLVVALYREQITELAEKLAKDRNVYVVTGSVKDQERVIQEADKDPECFLIVQASIGAGWEAKSFSCMVFASMAYGVRNYVQMKARIRRIDDLKPVIHYHLLAGKGDRAVYNAVMAGKTFVPSEYATEKVQ